MRAKVERRGIGGEDIEVRRSKHRGVGATHPTAADPPGPSVVRPTTIDSRFVSSASRGSTTPARLARPDQDAVAQGRSRPPAAAHGRVGTAYRGRGRSSSSAPRPSSLEARGGAKAEGDAGARRHTRARGASPKASAFRRHACNANSTIGLPRTTSVIAEWHCYASCMRSSVFRTRYFLVSDAMGVARYRVRVAYKPSRDGTRPRTLRVLAVARRTRRYAGVRTVTITRTENRPRPSR